MKKNKTQIWVDPDIKFKLYVKKANKRVKSVNEVIEELLKKDEKKDKWDIRETF